MCSSARIIASEGFWPVLTHTLYSTKSAKDKWLQS
jgi:hypothetical protein